jgi:hypothetical protein
VCLVVGCIHVTRRVLLCRLFGLPHMHQRLCLAMQKRSSGQALKMRPKSAHLWSQAHAMHSQAAAGLARSAMLPRYGNQSGPKGFIGSFPQLRRVDRVTAYPSSNCGRVWLLAYVCPCIVGCSSCCLVVVSLHCRMQ